MSALVVIDDRAAAAPWSTWDRVSHAIEAGQRVRLRPGIPGGFDLVKNGPALLATDSGGSPIGTYHDVGAAIDAWRTRRGVAS